MTRGRLPNRRTSYAIDFRFGRMSGVFTVGFSLVPNEWRCAEIFLNVWPSAGDVEKNIRDAAIVASVALQHGADLNELVEAVTHEEDGDASSIIGMALTRVRDAIRAMRDDGETPGPVAGPASPAGTGGAGVMAPDDRASVFSSKGKQREVAEAVGRYWRAHYDDADSPALELADPKEAQNDGDPVREAMELWPTCPTCGWRHAFGQSCTAAAAAAALTHTALAVETCP